ncbi:hypothetical protein CULT_100067 [[Clostridium] ultunense Esp]|nr:hypothetical protein CULT_100067 [[Clostridium] ultunense Esp]
MIRGKTFSAIAVLLTSKNRSLVSQGPEIIVTVRKLVTLENDSPHALSADDPLRERVGNIVDFCYDGVISRTIFFSCNLFKSYLNLI